MTTIEEIKKARQNLLTDEQKSKLLEIISKILINNDHVIIASGSHFPNPKWCLEMRYLEVPYSKRAAVKDFLNNKGFYCKDYINGFGVNYGLEVRI